jgi:hypothetical protein
MDPISSQNVNLVRAIQALQVDRGTAAEGTALTALIGQDVEVLFQALTAEGVKLQLPSGQTVTAEGELPYPEGSQLRVRILPPAAGDTGLRIQVQEARPPVPPSLLSPLLQGEAQALATRLNQESVPPELAPLMKLLALLADSPPGGQQVALPSAETLQSALRQLPEALLTSLGKALGVGGLSSTLELTTSLQSLFQETQQALPEASNGLLNTFANTLPTEGDAVKGLQALIQQVVTRFQALVAQHPEIPEDHKDVLTTWIRNQLQQAVPMGSAPSASSKPSSAASTPGANAARPNASDALVSPKLLAALAANPGAKAAIPESWESWIRGTVTTLANPAASPREAVFHALQAKEGTAFFEIPLPWAQASSLQIWVESDAPEEERQGHPDRTKRVLLGLNFSQLGETRLGMAQGSFGLQIRVWTEHPEALEADKEHLEEELKGLGKTLDLRIYGLMPGPDGTIPTIRSVVVGPSLRALG